MEEIEATLYDGDAVIISGIVVLLDTRDVPDGTTGAPGWHAHASLPLGVLVEPQEELRLVAADGRSALVEQCEEPVVEGDRVLHEFVGLGALA